MLFEIFCFVEKFNLLLFLVALKKSEVSQKGDSFVVMNAQNFEKGKAAYFNSPTLILLILLCSSFRG